MALNARVTQSPWWLAGVFFATMLVMHLVVPGRLARRAEELREPGSSS